MENIIVNFQSSLNEMLTIRGLDSVKLGKELGLDPALIRRWRNKGIDVRLKTLIKLADYFNCSLDFLCGRSHDDIKIECKEQYPNFGEQLLVVMRNANVKPYQLFDNTKIMPSKYYYWLSGGEPSLTSLYQLAEYFNVTLDVLVGRQNREA